MINVAPIQTLDQELPRVTEVFTCSKHFFVYIFRCEVLCHTAVVCIAQLGLVVTIIKQVIYIYVVNIARYFVHVHVVFLMLVGLLVIGLFTATIRIIISVFKPLMCQYLWNCKSFGRLYFDHSANQALRFLRNRVWDYKNTG